ncbi:MAG: hypothetical protein AB7V27_11585 [Candidatus Binatia bacterium]
MWVLLLAIVAGGGFLLFDVTRLPTTDEARELATGTFERYAQQQKFDVRLFEGPTKAHNVGGVAYAYEWTYSDPEGKFTVLVLVDRGAWTHLSFHAGDSYDGSQAAMDEIDRLEQRIRERSRGTG